MAYHNPQLIKILAVIVKKPGNNQCADCNMPNPTWASFNLGLFICMNCSGVHRMLGTHITRVRSITLDNWDEAGVQTMAQVGNRLGNSYWEARLPGGGVKINAGTDERTRTQFIRNKYENRLWYGQPTAQQSAAATAVDDDNSDALRPGEENLTRAEKIARRRAQREAQGVSRPASVQPSMAGAASHNILGVTSPPPPASTGLHAPTLRHATSSPQIATHPTSPSGGGDLFAGMSTPARSALSPTYAQPPPAQSAYSQPSPPSASAAPQRGRRQVGASPWVQRPAGSEAPIAALANLSIADSTPSNSAATAYYATMASGYGGAGGPVDLIGGLASNGGPATAPAAPAAAFDFLNDAAPAAQPPATSPPPNTGGGSAFDFLSGDDATSPAAAGAPSSSGFDFMADGGTAQPAAAAEVPGGPHRSRITDDMFSGLVDEEEPAPVVSLDGATDYAAPPVRKASMPAAARDAPLPSLGPISAPSTALDDALTAPMPPSNAAYPPYAYPPPGAYPSSAAYPYPPPGAAPPANGAYPPYPYPPPGAYPASPGPLSHPHHPQHPHPHHPHHHAPPFYPYPPPGATAGYPPAASRPDPFAVVNPIERAEPSPPAATAAVGGEEGGDGGGGSAFGFM